MTPEASAAGPAVPTSPPPPTTAPLKRGRAAERSPPARGARGDRLAHVSLQHPPRHRLLRLRRNWPAPGPSVVADTQWARIEPLLPDRTPKRGGRWRDHREVIDAIVWKFQTGSQCVHLP
ncbi:transposase [Streptomyces sp. 8N616]|uniref:transposase n=1 Tax=Streptomyces sp. 8N616 TaxID=3457414 RepID=UPI003FD56811